MKKPPIAAEERFWIVSWFHLFVEQMDYLFWVNCL